MPLEKISHQIKIQIYFIGITGKYKHDAKRMQELITINNNNLPHKKVLIRVCLLSLKMENCHQWSI